MKIEEKYTVNWNVKNPVGMFAGLWLDFDTLQQAFDYIDSRKCPSDMYEFDMDPAYWDIQIVYSYTRTECGEVVEAITRTLPYRKWKEEYNKIFYPRGKVER